MIHGVSTQSSPQPPQRSESAPQRPAETRAHDAPDRLDLSEHAAEQIDGVRADLVARVRAEIAAGGYITDEKLDVVADALQRELNRPAAG